MIKITAFFNSQVQPAGWSESWWTGLTDLSAVEDVARKVFQKRAAFMSSSVHIVAVRLSRLLPSPLTSILTWESNPIVGSWGDSYDAPWTGIRVRVTGAIQGKQTRIFRGVPDFQVTQGKILSSHWAKVKGGLIAYAEILKSANWGLGLISKTAVGNILSVVRDLNNQTIRFNLFAAPPIPVGGLFAVNGIRGLKPSINQIYRAAEVGGDYILVRSSTIPAGTPKGVGRISTVTQAGSSVEKLELVGAGKRDTGRPFGLFRGRR